MLKCNISIIADDNIWKCNGGPPDLSFVFISDNKFIPTEVSTSTLRIPFKVKCYWVFFRLINYKGAVCSEFAL